MPDTLFQWYCYAPEEIYKSDILANVFYNSSEGFSTPVTSPLMPPKPARTERRRYFWRNSGKREVCMYVRILDPLEFRNNHKKESVDKFNAECSEGGKDVMSSSHSNRENSENVTIGNSGKNGIISYNNNYHEVNIKNNSESKGKQGEEGDEALRLPGINKGRGMMTSRIHDIIIREQQEEASLDTRVAKPYKTSPLRSRPSDSLGFRKAIQYSNKLAAIITICFGMIMQLLEVFSRFALRKPKSTIGNSRTDSVDEGMRCWCLFAVYFLFECLSILWKFRHRIWPSLIIEGLWIGNETISMTNRRFYQLTFRLVLARYRLRNLLFGNVFWKRFGLRSGSIMETLMEEKRFEIYLFPFSDFGLHAIVSYVS